MFVFAKNKNNMGKNRLYYFFLFIVGLTNIASAGTLKTKEATYDISKISTLDFHKQDGNVDIKFKDNTQLSVALESMEVIDFSKNVSTEVASNFSSNAELRLYPNPVETQLNISGVSDNSQLTIISSEGRRILSQKSEGNETSIDVSSLSKGIYFLKVSNGQAVKFIKK